MADFESKLEQLSVRGAPVGAEELIERIEAELAGDPLVVVDKQREGVFVTKSDYSAKTQAPGPGRGLTWALVTFAIVLTVGGLYFTFSGADRQVIDQDTIPTATTAHTPTTAGGEVVNGWPHTGRNPAGEYSWDGDRCAGPSCDVGFMHNGIGSSDIDIRFSLADSWPLADHDSPAVTVAGYSGIHRQIDAREEHWVVEIEGELIDIHLVAKLGTSQAALAEARAIIDSIRVEPIDNRLGFRLVFTLTTSDWNSG